MKSPSNRNRFTLPFYCENSCFKYISQALINKQPSRRFYRPERLTLIWVVSYIYLLYTFCLSHHPIPNYSDSMLNNLVFNIGKNFTRSCTKPIFLPFSPSHMNPVHEESPRYVIWICVCTFFEVKLVLRCVKVMIIDIDVVYICNCLIIQAFCNS